MSTNPAAETALPALTTDEQAAALAWIERGESSLRQLADPLGLAADELLEILTRPHVAAFLEAADTVIQMRSDIIARHNHVDAMQSLVALAKNPEADHAVRLRAAITILQGPPPRRDPASRPSDPGGPKSSWRPPTARLALPSPSPSPSASNRPGPSPSSGATSTPTTDAHPPLITDLTSAAPRLQRAAGATFARHDRAAAQPESEHLAVTSTDASPPTSCRPP